MKAKEKARAKRRKERRQQAAACGLSPNPDPNNTDRQHRELRASQELRQTADSACEQHNNGAGVCRVTARVNSDASDAACASVGANESFAEMGKLPIMQSAALPEAEYLSDDDRASDKGQGGSDAMSITSHSSKSSVSVPACVLYFSDSGPVSEDWNVGGGNMSGGTGDSEMMPYLDFSQRKEGYDASH